MDEQNNFGYEPPVNPDPAADPTSYDNNAAPAYDQPAYEQPAYEQPAYEQPAYDQTSYDSPIPQAAPAYDQNGYSDPGQQAYTSVPGEKTPEEKSATTVMILGIVSIALSVLTSCFSWMCCGFPSLPGAIVGVIGMVKAKKLKEVMLPEAAAKNLKIGTILSIVGLVLGVLGLLISGLITIVPMIIGFMSEM